MEEFPLPPSERGERPASEKKKSLPSWAARSDFLRGWWEQRHGENIMRQEEKKKRKESGEDDDDSESDDEKVTLRRRAGRFAGGLIKVIAFKEPVSEKPLNLPGVQASEAAGSQVPPTEAQQQTPPHHAEHQPDDTTGEVAAAAPADPAERADVVGDGTDTTEKDRGSSHAASTPRRPDAPAAIGPDAPLVIPHETVRSGIPAAELARMHAAPERSYAGYAPEAHAPYSGRAETAPVVVNNRRAEGLAAGALVGAVVADQLSRRRDRKLKKDLAGTQKTVHKQQGAMQQQRSQLETLQHQVQRQAEDLRAKRALNMEKPPESPPPLVFSGRAEQQAVSAQERVPVAPVRPEAVPVVAAAAAETVRAQSERLRAQDAKQQQEQLRIREQAAEVMNKIEETTETTYPAVRPIEILRKVEQAAEKNVPIERLYERRHEIKDEGGQAQQQQRAGIVYGSTGAHQPQLGAQISPLQHVAHNTPQDQQAAQRDIYKKAVAGGISGGVLLILLILLFFLVT